MRTRKRSRRDRRAKLKSSAIRRGPRRKSRGAQQRIPARNPAPTATFTESGQPSFSNEAHARPVVLRITRAALANIRETIGTHPAETGGMLGGDRDRGLITSYCFDTSARISGATYSPDHNYLSALLRDKWNPAGLKLMGFVHSHPRGCRRPSEGDRLYAQRILDANESIDVLFLPIVMNPRDGDEFEFHPFVVVRDGPGGVIVRPAELDILEGPSGSAGIPDGEQPSASHRRVDTAPTFARVADIYDMDRLAHSRVVAVGTGGAAAFLEDLARSGVGEFVLIDPDTVAESNIATQQVYRRDIGRPKVECVADRLRDINPNVRVRCRFMRDSDIDDIAFRQLLLNPFGSTPPVQSLICGFTDSFYAQARVNRLALNLGIPSLCAQLYEGGSTLELTYTYPGLTHACHRCILSSRYVEYLERGFRNDVGSKGTPIFATGRLNALKGWVAMALLHYRTVGDAASADTPCGEKWSDLLRRLDQRNLAWVRTDPAVSYPFDQVFAGAHTTNIVFDETIWRPQTPDGPSTGRATCPDCGGTGNLLDSVGAFADTRDMRIAPTLRGL